MALTSGSPSPADVTDANAAGSAREPVGASLADLTGGDLVVWARPAELLPRLRGREGHAPRVGEVVKVIAGHLLQGAHVGQRWLTRAALRHLVHAAILHLRLRHLAHCIWLREALAPLRDG